MDTKQQFDDAIENCKNVFLKKAADYGTSWRVYRIISVADQIYIKLKRIRTLQSGVEQRVGDDIKSEFEGIINYAIIGLIQLEILDDEVEDLPLDEVEKLYESKVSLAKKLMSEKNNDYGEAWREMSQESFVDLSLAKVLRIKQIVANEGKTLISEGIDANLLDILNYAVFALILMKQGVHQNSTL